MSARNSATVVMAGRRLNAISSTAATVQPGCRQQLAPGLTGHRVSGYRAVDLKRSICAEIASIAALSGNAVMFTPAASPNRTYALTARARKAPTTFGLRPLADRQGTSRGLA